MCQALHSVSIIKTKRKKSYKSEFMASLTHKGNLGQLYRQTLSPPKKKQKRIAKKYLKQSYLQPNDLPATEWVKIKKH